MRVKVSKGKTINTGNYESFRIDVGVEDDFEKITEGHATLSAIVDDMLATEISKLEEF